MEDVFHVAAFLTGGTGPRRLSGIVGAPILPEPDSFPVVFPQLPIRLRIRIPIVPFSDLFHSLPRPVFPVVLRDILFPAHIFEKIAQSHIPQARGGTLAVRSRNRMKPSHLLCLLLYGMACK